MTNRPQTSPADPRVMGIVAQHPAAATLREDGGRWVLTMVRELPHPVGQVWPKLTEPDELRKWSPLIPDRPLTSAGAATVRETPGGDAFDAEVLVSDPPRALVHRWGSHVLRWTLEPVASGCRLTLSQTFDEVSASASFAAGWHLWLAVLNAVLDGHDVDRVVGSRAYDYGWESFRDRYESRFD